MKQLFKEDFKRAFFSYPYLIAILLTLGGCVYGLYEELIVGMEQPHFNYGYAYLFLWAHDGPRGVTGLVAPLLVAIPFASSYYLDKKSGFLKYIYLRTERRKYIISRLFSNAVVGGSVLFFSFLILLAVLFILRPGPSDPGEISGAFSSVYYQNELAYLFILIGISFLFGATYATLSLAVSAYVNNQYIAIVLPFFVYFLPIFILNIFSLDYLDPVTTYNPGHNVYATPFTVLGQLFLFLTVGIILFYTRAMKEGEEHI